MAQILGADLSYPNILNTSTSLKSSKRVPIKFIFQDVFTLQEMLILPYLNFLLHATFVC